MLEDELQQDDNMTYAEEKMRTKGSGENESSVTLKP
jgi:hypothetical protein